MCADEECTGALQRQCLREATRRALGVCCPQARRQGLPRTGRENSTSSADRSISKVWNWSSGARCPPGQMQRRLQELEESQTCDTKKPTGGWLGQPRTLTAEQGPGARPQRRRARHRPGSPWKQGPTQCGWCLKGSGTSASHSTVQAWTPKNNVSSARSMWRGREL